jgi:DNA-binding SARP family transcriptional activator
MRFGILGPLLVHDGERPIHVAAARQRVLLAALLARTGQPVSAGALAETVWDGSPPPGAAATLRTHVMRLRRVLGPAAGARVITWPPGYLVQAGEDEVDLLLFAALWRDGAVAVRAGAWERARALLSQALELWRGPALADVGSQVLHRDEVPRLEQQRLQALEWHADADLQLGQHAEIVPELQDLAAGHPLRERFHAQLMLALYRCGRPADALAAYQDARKVLVTELGAEPGPELRELHQRILNADPDLRAAVPAAGTGGHRADAGRLPPVAPRELPAAALYFAGRRAELAALTGLLDRAEGAAGTVVISAIGGTAGAGKTALAVCWAHQVAERFPDGQLYVNLRGFDPSAEPLEPDMAVRGFLDALGVAAERVPASPQARAGLYRSLLADKRVLIVLDNARDENQVRPLLPASPGCLVVVTSRTELAGMVAAEGATPVTLDVLTEPEARQLLARRLGKYRVTAEPAAVTELIGLCARLPLALAVTAARAAAHPGFPLAALAAELRDERTRLNALDAADPTTSIQAAFSCSYQQLSPPAARLFRLLGLHPGPDITTPAAASLAGISLGQARELLRDLARGNLLAEPAPGRYAFHDLLRAYAAARAKETDSEHDCRAALARLFDYYLSAATVGSLVSADRHRRPTISPQAASLPPLDIPEAARTWLDERALFAAIAEHTATGGGPAPTTHLATVLSRYYSAVGRHHFDVAAVHTYALAAARQAGDRAAQADALWGCATADFRRGQHRRAVDQLWQALAAYRELGDLGGQGRTVCHLGVLSYYRGDYQTATGYLQRAVALHRENGDRLSEGLTLDFLGLTRWRACRYHQAAHCHQRAVTVLREIAFRRGEACALANLAAASHRLGRYPDAVALCDQARALFRGLGDPHGEAGVLQYQAVALHGHGLHEEAASRHQQALAMFDELGDLPNQARAHCGLACACYASGDLDQARHHWQCALALYTSLGMPEAGQARAKLDDLVHTAP